MRLGMRLTLMAMALCVCADSAIAQTSPRRGRWQVEVVGGGAVFAVPSEGEAALPAPGASLTTSSPTNPSRRVPTWFLEDGASLLNGANREFGVAAQLPSLDASLARLGLIGENAPVAGLRLQRHLTSRLALEVGAEVHLGASEIDPDLLQAAEAARAGFVSAFTGLFATGPFTNVSVTATNTTTAASSRELALTAGVRFHLSTGGFAPYLTLGGGVTSALGARPRITLQGDYRFTFLGQTTYQESDTLVLRFDQSRAVVGIAGAGFQAALSDRLAATVDGRVHIGSSGRSLRLDSTPSVTTATPAGVVESFTTPAVQFSNNSTTGRQSTLSGTPLGGFKAFSTSGVQLRYVITAGLAVRF